MKNCFFFYHKLNNVNKIHSLGIPCTIEEGSVLVGDYNEESGHLSLGNNKVISGKLVSFKRPMNDVLKELNNSCHNLSVGKTKSDMTTILVNVNNQLKDANIIF